MEITEVRIKLMEGAQDRLFGFCSITIDRAFVVRDLKIIKGSRGFFVAMPSRKLTDRCPHCGGKNHLRAGYCSHCGQALRDNRSLKAADGRAKLYADIAHPINSECRDLIQDKVLQAYDEELVLAQQPGYVCRYDDFGEFDLDHEESDRWDDALAKTDAGKAERQQRPNAAPPAADRKPESLAIDGQRRIDPAHAPAPHVDESPAPGLPVSAIGRSADEFGAGVF